MALPGPGPNEPDSRRWWPVRVRGNARQAASDDIRQLAEPAPARPGNDPSLAMKKHPNKKAQRTAKTTPAQLLQDWLAFNLWQSANRKEGIAHTEAWAALLLSQPLLADEKADIAEEWARPALNALKLLDQGQTLLGIYGRIRPGDATTPEHTMTTRNGKIARLPRAVREQLNRRLDDGEDGAAVMKWLNGLPEVREALARDFGGEPISAQNLTNWRQGGFLEWQRHQDALGAMRTLAEQGRELEAATGGVSPADLLANGVTAALSRQVAIAAAMDDGPEKLNALLNLSRETARLRHGDHARRRMDEERARQQAEQSKAREQELAALAEEEMKAAGGDMLNMARSMNCIESHLDTLEQGTQLVHFISGTDRHLKLNVGTSKIRELAADARDVVEVMRWHTRQRIAGWEQEDERRLSQRAQLLADGLPVPDELEQYARLPLTERLRWLRREEEADADANPPDGSGNDTSATTTETGNKAASEEPGGPDPPAPPAQTV